MYVYNYEIIIFNIFVIQGNILKKQFRFCDCVDSVHGSVAVHELVIISS